MTRTRTRGAFLFAALLAVPTLACSVGDDDGGGEDPLPAAPSGLAIEELEGGAHLTWTDNSDNETQFMIMRMDVTGGGDYTAVATPPFDTVSYHDAVLTSGNTYMYMVMAMNDAGMSDESNEAEFTAP